LVGISPARREARDAIAVGGKWNALPRHVRIQTAMPEAYREDVRRVLRERGLGATGVEFTRVLRVDLDGDGTDEVILNATNQRPNRLSFTPESGDYSVVVVRRLVRGKVKTILVDAACYPRGGLEANAAATVLTVPAVLDANGDGVMEVLVRWQYYEGSGVDVYALEEGAAKRVIGAGGGL
jgi:hypothetical protein